MFVASALGGVCLILWAGSAWRERARLQELASQYPGLVKEAKSLGIKTSFDELIDDLPKFGPGDATALVTLLEGLAKRQVRSYSSSYARGDFSGENGARMLQSSLKLAALTKEVGAQEVFRCLATKFEPEEVMRYDFPVELTAGASLLAIDAERAARDGDTKTSLENLKAIVNVGRLLTDCASLKSYNNRLTNTTMVLECVRRAAAVRPGDPEFLAALRTEIIEKLEIANPRKAACNEAFLSTAYADKVLQSAGSSLLSMGINRETAESWNDPVCRQGTKVLMLRSWIRLVKGIDASWPDWNKLMVVVRDISGNRKSDAKMTPQEKISQGFAPSFVGAITTAQTLEARRRLTGSWLSVLEHRAVFGDLPAELPVDYGDLYTGAGLHYAADGDAFKLYSFGMDGKDDGGATIVVHSNQGADLGFDTRRNTLVALQGR